MLWPGRLELVALVSCPVLCAATLTAVTLTTVRVLVELIEGLEFLASLACSLGHLISFAALYLDKYVFKS
jgi:hypothetical protein